MKSVYGRYGCKGGPGRDTGGCMLLVAMWGGMMATLWLLTGCGGPPISGGPRLEARVEHKPVVTTNGGDATVTSETEIEERVSESGVEVAEGDLTGDVTTNRFGLDVGTLALLQAYGEQALGVLGKVVGAAVFAVIGLLLLALCSNPPAGVIFRRVGQVVGLVMFVGGPLAIWFLG